MIFPPPFRSSEGKRRPGNIIKASAGKLEYAMNRKGRLVHRPCRGTRREGFHMGRGWFHADSLRVAGEGTALSRLQWVRGVGE